MRKQAVTHNGRNWVQHDDETRQAFIERVQNALDLMQNRIDPAVASAIDTRLVDVDQKTISTNHVSVARAATAADVEAWLVARGAVNVQISDGRVAFDVVSGAAAILAAFDAYARDHFAACAFAQVRCRNTYTGVVTSTIVPSSP